MDSAINEYRFRVLARAAYEAIKKAKEEEDAQKEAEVPADWRRDRRPAGTRKRKTATV